MRVRAGAEDLPDMMFTANLLLVTGLLLWASFLWHLVLYGLLRRRIANLVVWAVLFLLPCTIGAKILYESRPSVRVRALLQYAQLAPLPGSATGVRYYSWSSPFSGEDFLRFTADPDDIEQFLAESPALKGKQPETSPADREGIEVLDGQAPAWYDLELKGPFRIYEVQPPRYQFPGELVVDDETNTVYLHLIFS